MKLVIYSLSNSSQDERFDFLEENHLQIYDDYKEFCNNSKECSHGEYKVNEMQMDHAPTGAKRILIPFNKIIYMKVDEETITLAMP